MNIKTSCCESMLITCFVSCLEMWDVIWEMRFKFVFCLRLFEMIRFRDHAWSSHRQFFWSSSLTFWRMTHTNSRLSSDVCLFSICRATYVCSRLVERRLWWDVIKLDETFHQTHCEQLIKFDESDSSNLMSENVISSKLTKATHRTWRKRRHFIKLNERVISSNFWEERQFLYFLMSNLLQLHLMWINLILQRVIFFVRR
jgi:hypothetical protein